MNREQNHSPYTAEKSHSARTEIPTRASSWFALLVTILTIGLFAWQIPEIRTPLVVGATGAIGLSLLLWLIRGGDRVSTFFAGVLSVPVAVGIAGGGIAAMLVVATDLFPVPDASLLSLGSLLVVGYAGIVMGASLAIFGVTLGVRNVASREVLKRATDIVMVTAVAPGVIAIVSGASALFIGGVSLDAVLSVVRTIISTLFLSVDGPGLHLWSLLFLLAIVFGTVRLALSILPVKELLFYRGESTPTHYRTLDRLQTWLAITTVVTSVIAVVLLGLEIILSVEEFRGLLGSPLYSVLHTVSTASLLRYVLVLFAGVTILALVVGYSARRVARTSSTEFNRRLSGLFAGVVLFLVVVLVGNTVYTTIVDEVTAALPGIIAGDFQSRMNELGRTYGTSTVVLFLTTALIGFTGFLLYGIRLSLYLNYLGTRTIGYSLAAVGLFVGTIFASTVGAPIWLILVGIVASFTVWDAGRFATTLGHEVGPHARTRSTEIVHVAATLFVGLVGALLAVGTLRFVDSYAPAQSPASGFALFLLVLGLILLVEALR